MTKRRRAHEELNQQRKVNNPSGHHRYHHQRDDDFIPLPIQTFLWRQTSPFVRPFLGKARDLAQIEQRDACKLFERIIITNNIWGQSPSLTDAISSIDRWRLIKVSFPFVLQCTASLLNNKLIKDHNFNRLGGNEAKMMYTLQWILMNAFEECADSENEAKNKVTSVAIAAATAASLSKSAGHTNLGEQQQQQQEKGDHPSSGRPASEQQSARVGSASSCAGGQSSMALPAAAVAAVAIAQPVGVSSISSMRQLQLAGTPNAAPNQQRGLQSSSSSVSPMGPSTPTRPLTPTGGTGATPAPFPAVSAVSAVAATVQAVSAAATVQAVGEPQGAAGEPPAPQSPAAPMANQYLLPISSIQMFVYYFAPIMDGLKHSDFLSSNQRLEIGAALWEPLFNHLMPPIHCLTAQICATPPTEQPSPLPLEAAAPSVPELSGRQAQAAPTTVFFAGAPRAQASVPARSPCSLAAGYRVGAATGELPSLADRCRSSSIAPEPSHYGDVFLGGQTQPQASGQAGSGGGSGGQVGGQPRETGTAGQPEGEEARPQLSAHLEEAQRISSSLAQATYLDVSVLRCLFITDWQESGVHWAIEYLAKRFNEKFYTKSAGGVGGPGELAGELARRRRRSKSLHCLTQADFRRSLALRREKFRRSRAQERPLEGHSLGSAGGQSLGSASGETQKPARALVAEIRISRDESSASASADEPQASPASGGGAGSERGAFLRVAEPSEEQEGLQAATRGEPKSPVRRLSFSSGMQTLANQIRKTSKRVKKANGQQQAAGAQDEGAPAGHWSPLRRHRRSSSADELSSGQLSALAAVQREQLGADQRLAAESQPAMATGWPLAGPKEPAGSAGAKRKGAHQRQTSQEERLESGGHFDLGTSGHFQLDSAGQLEREGPSAAEQQQQQQQEQERQYLVQELYERSLRHLERLTRSQTLPRSMRFGRFEAARSQPADKADSLGANYYVDEQGRIDPLVVLKVLHSVSQREGACSLRVCERLLFLLLRLIKVGVLSECYAAQRRSSEQQRDLSSLLASSAAGRVAGTAADQEREGDAQWAASQRGATAQRVRLIHRILIDVVLRIQSHLGCPNQCGAESTVGQHFVGEQRARSSHLGASGAQQASASSATTGGTNGTALSQFCATSKLLRAQLREALDFLCQFDCDNFVRYIQDAFDERPLRQVVELLHGALGFCRPDYFLAQLKSHAGHEGHSAMGHSAIGNPQPPQQVGATSGLARSGSREQSQSSGTVQFASPPMVAPQGASLSCSLNVVSGGAQQEAGRVRLRRPAPSSWRQADRKPSEPVESVILASSLQRLVGRMAAMARDFRHQENALLYYDIRRLVGFVREHYPGNFRAIVLSSLIECTRLMRRQESLLGGVAAGQLGGGAAAAVQPGGGAAGQPGEGGHASRRLAAAQSEDESSSADLSGQQARAAALQPPENPHSDSEGAAGPQSHARPHSHAHSHSHAQQLQARSGAGSHRSHAHALPPLSTAAAEQQHTPTASGPLAAPQLRPLSPLSLESAKQDTPTATSGLLSLSKAKKKLEQVFGGDKQQSPGQPAGPKSAARLFSEEATSGGVILAGDSPGGLSSGAARSAEQQLEAGPKVAGGEARELARRASGAPEPAAQLGANRQTVAGPQQQQQQQWAACSARVGPHLSVQLIKQNQLIYEAVHSGMANFSFLMESCLPGDFLDPALLAALLDLRSPVGIRAAIFLECANFVNRCNRGQWPWWMRMSWQQQAQQPQTVCGGASSVCTSSGAHQHAANQGAALHHRGSNAGLLQSSATSSSSKYRKSSSMQRTARNNTLMYRSAGRAFYAWAEAVGTRLEELLQQEELQEATTLVNQFGQPAQPNCANDQLSSQPHASAKLSDTEDSSSEPAALRASCTSQEEPGGSLDFLQPSIGGETCPFVLKMAACQLLFEVTTFLRETFRYLPPTIVQHQLVGSKAGDKLSSIYDVSRAVTANRRWSMALSSLGFGQLPATLSALSSGSGSSGAAGQGPGGAGGHLRTPMAAAPIPEQPERRISFILHETRDETDECLGAESGRPEGAREPSGGLQTEVGAAPQGLGLAGGRHLSQSSASSAVAVAAATLLRSSGVLDSSAHRRKSIKLKKSSEKERERHEKKQAKFAQDFDEETENSSISDVGVRRSDSVRSRRRVSGISERSDTSDAPAHQQQQQQQMQQQHLHKQQQQAELSGNESLGNGSEDTFAQAPPGEPAGGAGGPSGAAAERLSEADETRIMSHMPWFRAILMLNSKIDCNCTHYPTCGRFCYKLHQNTCKRLVAFVQTIYQDPTGEQSVAQLLQRQLAHLLACEPTAAHSQTAATGTSSEAATSAASELASEQGLLMPGSGGAKGPKKAKGKGGRQAERAGAQATPKASKKGAAQQQRAERGATQSVCGPGGTMFGVVGEAAAQWAGRPPASACHGNARAKERHLEEAQIVKYLRSNVKSLLHCPMAAFLKGAIILARDSFLQMIQFSWNLLLEDDQQLSRTAAVCFIISSIKCPHEAAKLLIDELQSGDASRKLAAINKFYVVWEARYQCWPRLEDGAFVHFKMAPPSIEFTLPSPKIAHESSPVVDPPWMPRKTSNVEEVTIGQDQTVQKSFVTATKTRRKQQIELVTKALREKHDKLREDREKYHITAVPVTLYAAFEPTLGPQASGASGALADESDGAGGAAAGVGVGGPGGSGGVGGGPSGAGGPGAGSGGAGDDEQQENRALLQMKAAQALFPTCLCQAAIVMINLLDDPRVTYEGSAVYEIASKVIWSCLVEDPALFLRYFFERLTRQNQSTIFQVLRRLIRFMPRLPPQAAYTLYNYLIGFIIYYIRCPCENSQKLIADTLSVLCLVVPSVHGLFLKDLKQILRKEQCDHNLLITANVPSAKKIIVHGSDSSGIPSQFPIDESTQFYHILLDSLEFFGIEKDKQNEYFLIDVRTNLMHNLHSYVRDYYSFKRSQHPQLQLINMEPGRAFDILQRQELINQFLESGKVSMSLSIVKSSHMAVQRVLFLHEELMKLPTFPRKALETNFSLFRGPLGHQVFSMDRIHKTCWVQVIARMFELTSGFFLQLGDIQLFLNAVSGIFVLHCEEASVSRLCLATFINTTHQFKSIFATDGFMPIMATIVQVYSNHQNNQLLCRSIEFVCKQFYIMHRKPFLLQLFGSVASCLNTVEILQQNYQTSSPIGMNQQQFVSAGSYSRTSILTGGSSPSVVLDPNRISPSAFFKLLLSLEKAFKDPLDILELVDAEKPLKAVDFCYQQDKESIEILDIISLCVTVTAYASESPRSTQMLIILESVVPLYMKYLQANSSKRAGQSTGKQAHKDELQKIQSISICIRTLIINCEGLTRNFSGPLPAFDFRSSSIRRTNPSGSRASAAASKPTATTNPMDLYNDEHSCTGPELSARAPSSKTNAASAPPKQATFAAGSGGGGAGGAAGGPRGPKGAPAGGSGGGTTAGGVGGGSGVNGAGGGSGGDETELTRGEFIVPRDTLLNLVAEFLALSTGRLVESAKKYVELHQKHSSYELLDVKSHLRLAEVANSLLKFASTDPSVMACRGLIRYMNEILPNTEWRQEAIRPALIMILKRLDKTFNRIAKKNWVRRNTDWEAAKQLLKGAYLTFIKHPYIVHLPHLKSLISCCQNIIMNEGSLFAGASTSLAASPASLFVHNLAISAAGSAAGNPSPLGAGGSSCAGGPPAPAGSPAACPPGGLQAGGQAGLLFAQQRDSSRQSPAASSEHQAAGPSQQQTGALAGGAVSMAERLASASSLSASTSQGFNSVTIRLIAMQLLQTGDTQTLESFIGNSMNTPEKLESLMLNLVYPMCIRVCSGAREAPKLRPCDIMFILNTVLGLLAPQSASSKSCSSQASSPKSTTTDASQFILSKITTTIGSTQTGATALGIVSGAGGHSATSAHHPTMQQHQESLKIGFLGLKILCVCFEGQLANEWVRISRVIRDLALAPGQPSGALWDFLDFVATYRFPVFVLLVPTIRCQLAHKIQAAEPTSCAPSCETVPGSSQLQYQAGQQQQHQASQQQQVVVSNGGHALQCLRMIEAKIRGPTQTASRSKSFSFVSLTAELRMLKEHLIAKRKQMLEGERHCNQLAAGGPPAGQQLSAAASSSGSTGAASAGAAPGQWGAASGQPGGEWTAASDHPLTAYHRLSAAIASFTTQAGQCRQSAGGATGHPLGTGAALKGAACFAAQLATSTPISNLGGTQQQQQQQQDATGQPSAPMAGQPAGRLETSQSSIRLSAAKSREEARRVMNTILRRTSYPHNQPVLEPTGQPQSHAHPQTKSGAAESCAAGSSSGAEALAGLGSGSHQDHHQIIMDPAMLMAAFPAPRRVNTAGSGILKQLVQTIDRQNDLKQKGIQQQQQEQQMGAENP